jgi:hypothetical protein
MPLQGISEWGLAPPAVTVDDFTLGCEDFDKVKARLTQEGGAELELTGGAVDNAGGARETLPS